MFSICPLSALLGVQLLPQPRLRVQRQSAARWFRRRSHEFNRMSCGRALHLAWSLCRRKPGGRSVRRAEMAAWEALISAGFRRQCSWQLSPDPASLPRSAYGQGE